MHILFMPSLPSFFLCFLIILVSYSSIAIQIFFGKQPHCHCAKNREIKLTTFVSSLLRVPLIIFRIYYEVPLRTPRTILLRKIFRSYSVLSIFFISCKLTDQSKYYKFRVQKSFFHFCIAYRRRSPLMLSRLTRSKAY